MIGRDEKKEQILQAGLKVLYLQGYNGTGVKDVVDAAGIPKGSFYNYFESKEDFALEALETVCESSCEKAEALLKATNLPPLERLQRFYAEQVKAIRGNGYQRGCLMGNLCQEMADVNEPIRHKVSQVLERMTGVIEACLREAQEKGELAPGRDTKKLAEFIFNAWEGTLTRMKGDKNDTALRIFLDMLPVLLKG